MRVEAASDSSLFISFGDSISLEAHRRVISLFQGVERMRDSRIYNLHPAYSSLLIDFDPLLLTHEELESLVAPLMVESTTLEASILKSAILKSAILESSIPKRGGRIRKAGASLKFQSVTTRSLLPIWRALRSTLG